MAQRAVAATTMLVDTGFVSRGARGSLTLHGSAQRTLAMGLTIILLLLETCARRPRVRFIVVEAPNRRRLVILRFSPTRSIEWAHTLAHPYLTGSALNSPCTDDGATLPDGFFSNLDGKIDSPAACLEAAAGMLGTGIDPTALSPELAGCIQRCWGVRIGDASFMLARECTAKRMTPAEFVRILFNYRADHLVTEVPAAIHIRDGRSVGLWFCAAAAACGADVDACAFEPALDMRILVAYLLGGILFWTPVRLPPGHTASHATLRGLLPTRPVGTHLCISAKASPGWASPHTGCFLHRLFRARVARTIREATVSRIVAMWPHMAFWVDVARAAEFMGALANYMPMPSNAPLPVAAALSWMCYLHLQDDETRVPQLRLRECLVWTASAVNVEDGLRVELPAALLDHAHQCTGWPAQASALTIPHASLTAGPSVTVDVYRALVNFGILFSMHLRSGAVRSGFSSDGEWLVVPQILMVHADRTPGGCPATEFRKLAYKDHARIGVCNYEVHADDGTARCWLCGENVQSMEDACVAVRRASLTGRFVFVRELLFCAQDIFIGAMRSSGEDMGNETVPRLFSCHHAPPRAHLAC